MENSDIKQELAQEIIDELISKADDINTSTFWGEPGMLLCDVINIINNKLGTDYKRYWAYGCKVKYERCSPKEQNPYCSICKEYWRKQENKQGCLGVKLNENSTHQPCEKYKSTIDDE